MNINELALAYWRLSRWVNKAPVERKTAANNALRQIRQYLADEGIETIEFTGQKYDCGLAIDVLENEASPDCPDDELVITETIRPTILKDGNVIKYGQVIVGKEKQQVPQQAATQQPVPQKTEGRSAVIQTLISAIDAYRASDLCGHKFSKELGKTKKKLTAQLKKLHRKETEHEEIL